MARMSPLVAWGNTIEKSLEALEKIGNEISIELIDLRSIVPWDEAAIEESVRKTGDWLWCRRTRRTAASAR